MKKLLAIVLFAASAFSVKAQNNYLLTKTGEKVTIMSDLSLDAFGVGFKTANSAKKNGYESVGYKDTKIKMFEFDGRVFMVLPDGKKEYILEIVCFNDKYILACWFWGGMEVWIKVFDWDFNSLCKLKTMRAGKNYQKKDLEERIKPYFGDCPNVIDAINKNIANKETTNVLENISAVKCSTNKTINDLIQKFLALPAPTK